MFPKCFLFVVLVVVSSQLKGTACFFVKWFRGNSYIANYGDTSKNCIKDTGIIQSNGSWGNLSFLGYIDNSCLDPAGQFVFRDNGAMLNLKRQGCLAAFNKNGSGYNLDMFYLYVDSVSLDTAACAQKPNESIYRAITMTPDGGLSVYYKFQTWCASYTYHSQLSQNYGINRYMPLSTQCNPGRHTDGADAQRFIFGSVTCHGDKVKNANCPKDQYMVVKFATYRGLLAPKKCGLSNDYSCEVDVTCLVKKQCDGLHECNITVNDTLFPSDQCPGLSNYLYFEYQCVDTVKRPFKELCVYDVSLSYSSLPYEGVVQITTDSGTKNVCWESLEHNDYARHAVCRHLGYDGVNSFVSTSAPTNTKNSTFSGSIGCEKGDKFLSQCSINASVSETCSALSYIQCGDWVYYPDYYRPVLQRLPDSSFSATGSLQGHNASNARISSGSSWCAPISNDTHYLQVDFGKSYLVSYVLTYGDSSSPKWVASYNLNYTNELAMRNWKNVSKMKNVSKNIKGNKNAYNHAGYGQVGNIEARALRFNPFTYVGQPCMRVEVWGETQEPDKPTSLTITEVTTTSVEISWLDPEYHGYQSNVYKHQGYSDISRFWIKLKKENSVILNITTGKVNRYTINNLTPYTTYEISVAAGNNFGFSEETSALFLTSGDVPRGSALNIRISSSTTSSLSLNWEPPGNSERYGVIINYTACISHSENGPCFQTFTTREKKWLVVNLNPLTKYYVRVVARSNKFGHGNYSESKEFFTSATWKPDKPRNLIITNVTSRSAEISWLDPISQGHSRVSHFLIELKKGNSLILNTITRKVNKYKINHLTPYTIYEIFVAARNGYDIGEKISSSFLTSEEVPSGPPLNTRTSSRTTSSLSLTWDPPENSTRNGVIISYTACISHSENGPCFQTFITSEKKWLVGNLNLSTKYYVRVFASTKVGHGNYSESKEFFTNESDVPSEKDDSNKYLIGMIVAILVVILILAVIIALFFHFRRKSSDTEPNGEKTDDVINPQPIYDDVVNYIQVLDEQSIYTTLNRPGEATDDHLYAHLNEVIQNMDADQKETGF